MAEVSQCSSVELLDLRGFRVLLAWELADDRVVLVEATAERASDTSAE